MSQTAPEVVPQRFSSELKKKTKTQVCEEGRVAMLAVPNLQAPLGTTYHRGPLP